MVTKKQLAKKIHTSARLQKKQPGLETKMQPKPLEQNRKYQGCGKLRDKVAIITGGDSGIGHAVALCFAKEGADIVIAYLNEHTDAKHTQAQIKALDQKCLLISADLSQEKFCKKVINQTIKQFGKLDILINNAGEQFSQKNIEDVTAKQILKTFSINIFSYFYMIKAALL